MLLGNPLKYNGDKTIADKINDFSSKSNEDYHNQLMLDDLLVYGRAFEYIGRDEYGKEMLAKFSPEETFIYDTTTNKTLYVLFTVMILSLTMKHLVISIFMQMMAILST